MKKYISCNNGTVEIISSTNFFSDRGHCIETNEPVILYSKFIEPNKRIRLGYICNWNQQCGISTYSRYVYNELKELVDDSRIFSEYPYNNAEEPGVVYCWKRGEHLNKLLSEIKKYKPTVLLLQHEWGIFPKAGMFMSFIAEVKKLGIPMVSVLHSVYDHLDKTIPLSMLDNVIVHSNEAKKLLKGLRFRGNVFVIPHGCPDVKVYKELWNIFQVPYVIFGYGFGFKYKGVDVAIDAIKYLRDTQPKFKNILYVYACSESETNKGIHDHYYNMLSDKVEREGLQDNVVLIKGFLSEDMLDTYLKTVKMVVFPYVHDPDNIVYGSSGACKIAMSYKVPVIVSKSHMFDDVERVLPRVEGSKSTE